MDINTNDFFLRGHGTLSKYGCAKFNRFKKSETILDSMQSIKTLDPRIIN